jgi:hypothetical protein
VRGGGLNRHQRRAAEARKRSTKVEAGIAWDDFCVGDLVEHDGRNWQVMGVNGALRLLELGRKGETTFAHVSACGLVYAVVSDGRTLPDGFQVAS